MKFHFTVTCILLLLFLGQSALAMKLLGADDDYEYGRSLVVPNLNERQLLTPFQLQKRLEEKEEADARLTEMTIAGLQKEVDSFKIVAPYIKKEIEKQAPLFKSALKHMEDRASYEKMRLAKEKEAEQLTSIYNKKRNIAVGAGILGALGGLALLAYFKPYEVNMVRVPLVSLAKPTERPDWAKYAMRDVIDYLKKIFPHSDIISGWDRDYTWTWPSPLSNSSYATRYFNIEVIPHAYNYAKYLIGGAIGIPTSFAIRQEILKRIELQRINEARIVNEYCFTAKKELDKLLNEIENEYGISCETHSPIFHEEPIEDHHRHDPEYDSGMENAVWAVTDFAAEQIS